jgi:hypothetical protein
MAWITVGRNTYYYRSQRVGKSVRLSYYGRGPEAELAAALDARRRQERQQQRERVRAERERWKAATRALKAFLAGSSMLVEAALLAAGYRRHERGEYRRWRLAMTDKESQLPDKIPPEFIAELVRRAQHGDESTVTILRHLLDANPEVWRKHGDLAKHAEEAWLSLAAGPDLIIRESLSRKLDELKAELLSSGAAPVERLLVERVAITWLQATYADAIYAQIRDSESSAAVRKELMQRQESAQRRYLASLQQLVLVRKLLGMGEAKTRPTLRLAAQ